jgi:hypothetical protein
MNTLTDRQTKLSKFHVFMDKNKDSERTQYFWTLRDILTVQRAGKCAPNKVQIPTWELPDSETKQAFAVDSSRSRSPTLIPYSTTPILATMSDLCPVYAPFFGAMVSLHTHTGNFGRKTLIRRLLPSSTCRAVPVPSCLHVCLLRCRLSFYPYSHIYQVSERGKFLPFYFRASSARNCRKDLLEHTTYGFAPQLWDRKIWCWHFSYGCITTGSHDEERRSCHHGWYHRRECLYPSRTT